MSNGESVRGGVVKLTQEVKSLRTQVARLRRDADSKGAQLTQANGLGDLIRSTMERNSEIETQIGSLREEKEMLIQMGAGDAGRRIASAQEELKRATAEKDKVSGRSAELDKGVDASQRIAKRRRARVTKSFVYAASSIAGIGLMFNAAWLDGHIDATRKPLNPNASVYTTYNPKTGTRISSENVRATSTASNRHPVQAAKVSLAQIPKHSLTPHEEETVGLLLFAFYVFELLDRKFNTGSFVYRHRNENK